MYQPINGKPSITSVSVINVPTSYTFSSVLSSEQASNLPYINSLLSAVSAQLTSLITQGTVIDGIYKDYPYFQIVYRNNVYKQIVIIVSYDVLKNVATIISKSAVPNPPPTP